VSTQSSAVGGRKLVPSVQHQQQQQPLAVVSSHVEQPSNLAELLLGITLIIICLYRMHTDPGKSWNLTFKFSRPGKSWN